LKNNIIFFRHLGVEEWSTTFKKMNDFTKSRNCYTSDEIWFVEHYPIFTTGSLESQKNIFSNNVPVIQTNRGGKITYHGPGQQILYFLIDLHRRKINIRELINILHVIVMKTLSNFSIVSYVKKKEPGVYAHDKKICSLGLRISKGCTLHGLALNVDMDLTPFNFINPCGNKNIKMTQIKDFYLNVKIIDVCIFLTQNISKYLKSHMIQSCKK